MGVLARIRSSVTYPIAAALLLVTVAPVVVVGLRLAASNRENLTTTEKITLTRQAVGLASEISLFFSAHRTRLESAARALGAAQPVAAAQYQGLLQDIAGGQDEHAFVYLHGGGRLVLVLQDEDITDPHCIPADDPRRGIVWEIRVKDLRGR